MVLLLRAVFGVQVVTLILVAVVIYILVKVIESHGGDENDG